ncbi:unnamed protein product [Lactuca saligna]|uniref:Uncharacterized protein n=1 Tax=Lactuca saligna TaxID=75948 RepID=A0AA35YYB4_LACSI|nr:unnamed protein product [Lactuca saligna]
MANESTELGKVVDYKDWQISLSRRFQALKLWMVLMSYGTTALWEYIRKHVKMAKDIEGLVNMDARFEIMVPRYFSMVCFRVSPYAISQHRDNDHKANELNQMLLELVNATGRFYMTHSVVGGVYIIRFYVGAGLTEDRHVNMAWSWCKVKQLPFSVNQD